MIDDSANRENVDNKKPAVTLPGVVEKIVKPAIPSAPKAGEEPVVRVQRHNSCRNSRPRLFAERSDAQPV